MNSLPHSRETILSERFHSLQGGELQWNTTKTIITTIITITTIKTTTTTKITRTIKTIRTTTITTETIKIIRTTITTDNFIKRARTLVNYQCPCILGYKTIIFLNQFFVMSIILGLFY